MVTESETALLAEPEAGVDSLADRALVHRFVIDGDREAMEEVVSRHWPTALRVARRYTGNESDAEDCVQEALLRACRAAAQYDGRGTVRAWLLQSVVNACRMRFREEDARDRREQVAGDTEWLRRQGAVRGGDLEREEQRELVRAAMAELPERYRVPLWLRYVEDLTPQEVARALEMPEATARSQIHRGLKQVGERLRKGGLVLALPLLAGLLGELTAAEATPPVPAALAAGALPVAGVVTTGGGSAVAVVVAALLSAALTVVAGASAGAWDADPVAAATDPAASTADPATAASPPPAFDPDLLFDALGNLDDLRTLTATITTEAGRTTMHAHEPLKVQTREIASPSGPRPGFVLDARWEPGATEALVITRPFPDEPVLALECQLRLPADVDRAASPLQLAALLRGDRENPAPRRVIEHHPEALVTSGLLEGDWVRYRAELEHCQDDGAAATEVRYYLADRLFMRSRIELRSDRFLPVTVTDDKVEILDLQVRRAEPTLDVL